MADLPQAILKKSLTLVIIITLMKEKDHKVLKKIGANLLALRMEKGFTQEELSYQCDVDRAKISKIESGQANLMVTTLIELAKGLKVHPARLLDKSFEE